MSLTVKETLVAGSTARPKFVKTANCLCLHTTEGRNFNWLPGGRTDAYPHLELNPTTGEMHLLCSLDRAALALKNAGDFQTNRNMVIQIEIIGYAKDSSGWTPAQLGHIAEAIRWVIDRTDVKNVWVENWSGPNTTGVRMTTAQYKACYKIHGHQHVPGNNHWDPGQLPWKKIKALIDGGAKVVAPAPSPSPSGSYLARVTAKTGLNFRTDPGINYPVERAEPKGTVVTIVDEQNGWLKTKSGLWGSKEYLTRI